MERIATDYAPERNRTLIRAIALLGRMHRDGDCGWNFERSRHHDALKVRPGRFDGPDCPLQQGIGDILIKSRLNDKYAGPRKVRLGFYRSPAGLRHHHPPSLLEAEKVASSFPTMSGASPIAKPLQPAIK